jgi:hypothetical protein
MVRKDRSVESGGAHPFAAALLIGVFALTVACTFAGSIAMWLIFRDTGVNWLFQGNFR